MKHIYFHIPQDGFYGAYYPNPVRSNCAVILMLGDRIDDKMARMGVKWLHQRGCNVLTMAPETKDYAFHRFRIEYFESAIAFLKRYNDKVGFCGASTTAMTALTAASLLPDITLTIAISPSDFVMEGFYRDGLDGARERPGEGESSLSYRGEDLPYLPYAYRHPEYWNQLAAEAKRRGDMAAARDMFDRSEELCPVSEDMRIKVERIQGIVALVGAEDDSLWDTCRYIRRMAERLRQKPHSCKCAVLTYQHGSHFMFPQSMLEILLPVGSSLLLRMAFHSLRVYPRESKQTRIDLDRKLCRLIAMWQNDAASDDNCAK